MLQAITQLRNRDFERGGQCTRQLHSQLSFSPLGSCYRSSRLVFTLTVDDVDAMCAELAARGVTLLNGPMDRPWGIRTASFFDPGGHIWEIAKW